MFLGLTKEEADNIGYRGTTEGEKLKESGTYNWVQESLTGSNLIGFTGLPGGSGEGNIMAPFGGEGYIGLWWTATELSPDPNSYAWCRWVFCDASWIGLSEISKRGFLNVRCVTN